MLTFRLKLCNVEYHYYTRCNSTLTFKLELYSSNLLRVYNNLNIFFLFFKIVFKMLLLSRHHTVLGKDFLTILGFLTGFFWKHACFDNHLTMALCTQWQSFGQKQSIIRARF